MSETLEYVQTFARFPFALRRFLLHRLTLDEAKRIVRERMERREENFLAVLERLVYDNSRGPYRTLLQWAGCELEDARALVKQKGLEGALRELRKAGVFVTFEEFKGRAPIVRGDRTLAVKPADFDNPELKRVFSTESGGTTGAADRVGADFDRILARAPHYLLTRSAFGLIGAPAVVWRGILPDSTFSTLFHSALCGEKIHRWYAHAGWRDSKHWVKYDLATLYMLFWMRLYGTQTPFPKFIPVDRAGVIARELAELLKTHGRCSLGTLVSRALRVCLAARETGLDLTGVTIIMGGEPPTSAKVREIEKTGARHFPNYASSGAGTLGNGCAQPADFNDIHLFKDVHALITYPHRVEGFDITVPAFNLTSLSTTTAKVHLNTQMDDYGIVEERACGCEFESYGFTTHLREIRSYRKLTGEGVTLVGSEMIKILEQVLPARFGGTPLDYQLLEQEDERGFTRVYLVIHPRLHIPNEQQVIDTVLHALRNSSAMADSARTIWQQTDTLKIKRMEPVWTARGKLMPLHLDRSKTKS